MVCLACRGLRAAEAVREPGAASQLPEALQHHGAVRRGRERPAGLWRIPEHVLVSPFLGLKCIFKGVSMGQPLTCRRGETRPSFPLFSQKDMRNGSVARHFSVGAEIV